jgi:hypothetical protein
MMHIASISNMRNHLAAAAAGVDHTVLSNSYVLLDNEHHIQQQPAPLCPTVPQTRTLLLLPLLQVARACCPLATCCWIMHVASSSSLRKHYARTAAAPSRAATPHARTAAAPASASCVLSLGHLLLDDVHSIKQQPARPTLLSFLSHDTYQLLQQFTVISRQLLLLLCAVCCCDCCWYVKAARVANE